MIASFSQGMHVTYDQDYCIWFTVVALVAMTVLVNWAVFAILKLVKRIKYRISSWDDLLLVRNTINLDMMLVWPALAVIVTYLGTMLLGILTGRIVFEVFNKSMVLYLVGTILLGMWSKRNEKKLQTLDVDDPELSVIYEAMLKDWKRRWFCLLPMNSYIVEFKSPEVKDIANYTEM